MIQDFVEPKKRARKMIGANLSVEEYAVMDAIIRWRVEQGLSKDRADCVRQMMHFIVNKEYLQRYDFMQPSADVIRELINQEDEPNQDGEPDGDGAADTGE